MRSEVLPHPPSPTTTSFLVKAIGIGDQLNGVPLFECSDCGVGGVSGFGGVGGVGGNNAITSIERKETFCMNYQNFCAKHKKTNVLHSFIEHLQSFVVINIHHMIGEYSAKHRIKGFVTLNDCSKHLLIAYKP